VEGGGGGGAIIIIGGLLSGTHHPLSPHCLPNTDTNPLMVCRQSKGTGYGTGNILSLWLAGGGVGDHLTTFKNIK
jgi:hypothetical protein